MGLAAVLVNDNGITWNVHVHFVGTELFLKGYGINHFLVVDY